jgi:hypothetical protein
VSDITKVIAYVDLADDAAERAESTHYRMNVSLAARLDDGREIAGGAFGFGGPRDGVAAIWHRYRGPWLHEDPDENWRLLDETYHVGMADVQDAVNQMLGRDPEQHRPPRLSWEARLRALADQAIQVSEQQLIDTPLEIVLSESAAAEVNADPPGPAT